MATSLARQKWIDAAAVEFQHHGYTATGIAAIAARAGARKGSFYNHFGSKEALALEVIHAYARDARIDLLQGNGPALTRIRIHFAHLRSELNRRGDTLGCLLGNLAAEATVDNEGIRSAVDACFAMWVETLSTAIGEARVEHGTESAVASRDAAQLLIDAWEGALLRGKALKHTDPVESFMRVALDLTLSQ